MNDERLERELQAALLRDDPGAVTDELRRRVAAVPDEAAGRRGLVRPPRVPRLVAPLRAIAAVLVVGAIIVAALGLRGSHLGPASSPSPSATPTGPAPSASLSAAPTPSLESTPTSMPSAGSWRSLRWSAPLVFPDGGDVQDIEAWHGGLIAAGQMLNNEAVAFWRSSDGITWTRIGINANVFANSQINRVLATPTGFVAWGTDGQPTCTGQGEGETCGPTPIMVWTSSDGANWARIVDASTFSGATISAMAAGADGLVAVGDAGHFNLPAIWVSANGAAWTRLSLSPVTFKDAHFWDVRATASGYVLAGQTAVAAAWWSPDGRSWTTSAVQRVNGVGTGIMSVYVGARGMVAVGSASGGKSGTAWTSTDGRSWQPIAPGYAGAPTVAPGVPTLPSFSVFGDGTHLVAVGSAGGVSMWISADGVAWQPLPFSGATATIPADFYSAFLVPDGLIVVGQTNASGTPFWRVTALP